MPSTPPSLSSYPLRTHDKLRCADTDRQGHVKKAVFATMVGRSSVTVEQALFQDGRCAATARTVIVQVNDAKRRSLPPSEPAVRRLAGFRPRQEPGGP